MVVNYIPRRRRLLIGHAFFCVRGYKKVNERRFLLFLNISCLLLVFNEIREDAQ